MKNEGFVLSCGGGCAMTYHVKEIKPINQASFDVKFLVEMYIDQEQTETLNETYIFNYGNINTIINAETNENTDKTLPENALKSFRSFLAKLIL